MEVTLQQSHQQQQLYLHGQARKKMTLLVPIIAISVVFIVALMAAIMFAAIAFETAAPLSMNAAALEEMELKSKLKTVQGVDPEGTLNDYLAIKRNLVGVDNLSAFPPHPAIDDLMRLTNQGNPWNVPSEVREREIRGTADASELSSLHVPQHQKIRMRAAAEGKVDQYLASVRGAVFKDRMLSLRQRLGANNEDRELFDRVFGENEIFHHAPPGGNFTDGVHQRDNDILAHKLGGHCNDPIPAVANKTCSELCYSSRAIKVKGPFVMKGVFVSGDVEYCWTRTGFTDNEDDIRDHELGGSGATTHYCSPHTAILVLTSDAGWQCRPKFPALFGGKFGTTPTACHFNPAVHGGTRDDFQFSGLYVDVKTGRLINSHSDFTKSTYFRLLSNSKSIREFKERARDPDLFFNNPITCKCSNSTDVLNNPLLDEKVARLIKFRGMYECMENPCNMVPSIDPDFSIFNAATGTCEPGPSAPANTVNAILGDPRTPLVGTVPAMGLILADKSKRADGVHIQRQSHPYNEEVAKEITSAAAPVVTAVNLDASNSTRNVLFVPQPSMVLPHTSNLSRASMKLSSVLHKDCLPPLLNKKQGQYRPFCTAPFYVEPAANVLAGHVPQKPYEHNMLVSECLRNSRMISGNVHSGAEILYSTLLSHDSRKWRDEARNKQTAGDARLEEIRDFFERNFNRSRRLSNTEYLARKNRSRPEKIMDGISPWDAIFRVNDFEKCGIKNEKEAFVLKEGMLIRSYGPYAAMVLAPSSFDFDFMRGSPDAKTPSALKPFNPLQFAFPTSHSVLPREGSPNDIFSVDKKRIFDNEVISAYFDCSSMPNVKNRDVPNDERLFPEDSSPLSHYRVDPDNNAWGLQTFRLDYNPRKGPVITSDPRLEFDACRIKATPSGATLTPLSLFKKTPLEWGHAEADMQRSNWFRSGIDTSKAHRRLLVESSMAVRNTWFSLTWENENYYFVKNTSS
uniref:Wsv035-like protein n=1 Tax=Metapenaeus ensis nimavirus TaxID=2133794 RepID=A0A401IP98_9VIRU|nr:MAG: wsv035-like protein [Metapenaeus ensis nimavirus]GBG35444.1 wsv035-like protein [Metapenaeus ensis nimavirus]